MVAIGKWYTGKGMVMLVKDEVMELIRVVIVDDEDFARVVKLFIGKGGEGGEIECYALDVDGEWIKIEHGHYPNTTKLSLRMHEAIDFISTSTRE